MHILSEQALQAMGALAPGSDFDVRRFRPTMLVDCPGSSSSRAGLVRWRMDTPHATFAADPHHPLRDAVPGAGRFSR